MLSPYASTYNAFTISNPLDAKYMFNILKVYPDLYISFDAGKNDIFDVYAFGVFAPLTTKKIKRIYAKIKLLLFALGGH